MDSKFSHENVKKIYVLFSARLGELRIVDVSTDKSSLEHLIVSLCRQDESLISSPRHYFIEVYDNFIWNLQK